MQYIISILTLTTFCSCNNSSTNKTATQHIDRIVSDNISIDDLKQKVKEECGDYWLKLIEKVKTPTEYPSGVHISRYYLRVTGKRKDNGQTVTKLIVIETPMGC